MLSQDNDSIASEIFHIPTKPAITRRTPSRVRSRQTRFHRSALPAASLEVNYVQPPPRENSQSKNKQAMMSIDVARLHQLIPKKRLQPLSCTNESAIVRYFRRAFHAKAGFYFASESQKNKRTYNEDRTVCIPRMDKPFCYEQVFQSSCRRSYFAVIDGHGGSACADFIAQNLHHYISRQRDLETSALKALKRSVDRLEKSFTEIALQGPKPQPSGACVIVCLLMGQSAYVVNVGDCHGVVLKKKSEVLEDINVDHKPGNKLEYQRIIENGGKLVREPIRKSSILSMIRKQRDVEHSCFRIQPGSLNVSRTIGDIEAKLKKLGGLPGVISAQPDIYELPIKDLQYIVLGSDGLFEGLSKLDMQGIYRSLQKELAGTQLAQQFVKKMLQGAATRSSDNLSAVCIIFKK